jgi:NAD(P)-dependent dehydrogenase (short-subunit alcohol dehydrogenase family)
MKTAIVTGGTRGIGAGLVRDFFRCGWDVAYSGTTEKSTEKSLLSLSEQFDKGNYIALKCDVTNEKDLINLWENTLKSFGRVDIWVNNAGTTNEQALFYQISPDEFMKIIDINIKGLMLSAYVSYNRMLLQGFGGQFVPVTRGQGLWFLQ